MLISRAPKITRPVKTKFSEIFVIVIFAAITVFYGETYAKSIEEADTVVIGRLLPQNVGTIKKPPTGYIHNSEELEVYFFEIVYFEKENGEYVRSTVTEPFNVERVAITRSAKKAYLGKGYHLWILEEFKWSSDYNFLQAIPIAQEDATSFTKVFDRWKENRVYREEFFPEGSLSQHLDSHIIRSRWYARELMTMGEGSIFELRHKEELEVYRFTLLRSFDNPILIRIEVDEDHASLKTTIASGRGEATGIQSKDDRRLTKSEIQQLRTMLAKKNFWEVTSYDDDRGTDGSNWIVEALSEGRYHVADRSSPKGGTVREIGELFLKLARCTPNELY